MRPVVVISTFPDEDSVTETAKLLVKDRVCACVNMLKISSVYSWNGKIESGPEYLAIFKTVPGNRNLLKRRIREAHPYDVPEIAEVDVTSVNDAYMRWLIESTVGAPSATTAAATATTAGTADGNSDSGLSDGGDNNSNG